MKKETITLPLGQKKRKPHNKLESKSSNSKKANTNKTAKTNKKKRTSSKKRKPVASSRKSNQTLGKKIKGVFKKIFGS